MSFGGAVSAMITSLKNNKRERKTRFHSKEPQHSSRTKTFVDFKKLTPSEEVGLKNKIRLSARRHQRKVMGYTAIALLILAVLIWLLLLDSRRPLV